MIPRSIAISIIMSVLEMPFPKIIGNSTVLKGGASLFLTILTRVLAPITSASGPLDFIAPAKRTSIRTEA